MDIKKENSGKLSFGAFETCVSFDLLVASMLIFSLVYAGISGALLDKDSILLKVLSYLCAPISIVLALVFVWCRTKNNPIELLKVNKIDKVFIPITILLTIGVMFGLSELNNLLVEFLTKLGFTISEVTLPPKTPLNVCLIIIFVCVVPAVMEEVFFRGLIINGLYKTGSVFACLTSGLLFSLFHMSPAQTIYQFIVGVIYALIVLHGGNYILTIISHLFNNLFIVLNYYFFNFYPVGELKVVLTILGLICLALGLFFVYSNRKEIPALEKKSNFFKSIPFGIIFCVVMWVIGLFSNG